MNKPETPFSCLGKERATHFLCDAQMLNVMADGLPGVVAYYDIDFICHFVNATVEAWTGTPPSAYLARRLGEVERDFAACARPAVERALAGAHAEFEAPVDFAGGMVAVVRGFAYPDAEAGGRVVGCFLLLLDITRERAFEAQLQAARDEAIEANRSKSRFIAAASHDLRQPLQAMTLFVSALSRRLREGEAAELVGDIDDSLRSLRAMIDTLLDLTKIEAGLIKPNLTPTSLAELFAALRAGFSATARERGLEFRVATTSAKVVADRTLAELALRNLLANAFKFTRSGGVLLGARRRRGEIGVAVVDTGVGVAADRTERVFEEFHRDRTTATGPNEGIGLGLAIVRRLAALMGGRVTLLSRPGRGSVFTLWLREAASGPRPERRPDVETESLAGRRILIVDDDPRCAAAMRQEFVDQGAVVAAAASIAAARAAIDASGMPEALIVDYDLSDGATGLQFVESLRARGAETSVVMISGSTDAAAVAALRGSGLPWLTKPVDSRALRATLIHALAR
ncbi:MAG: ATP-binding protein [Roseiarcus sp.]|jgi:signal transduction histidine kinase/CheY-like chemotaxis protein